MMWNFRLSGLLCGSTVVCYSGHPLYPDADRLWQLVADERVTYFGTSPGHLLASRKAGLTPGSSHDLSRLRTIGSTGSPLAADLFEWVGSHVGKRRDGVVDQWWNRRLHGIRRRNARRAGARRASWRRATSVWRLTVGRRSASHASTRSASW